MGLVRRQYKIKKETCGNKTGESFSLTVPKPIVEMFTSDTKWSVAITETSIIYTSGIDLTQLKKEAQRITFAEIK